MPGIPVTPQPYLPPGVTMPAAPGMAAPPAAYPPNVYPPQGTPLPSGPAPSTTQRPATLSISRRGPTQTAVGSIVTYRIEVRNSGPTTLAGVQVSEPLDVGLSFLDSNPPAAQAGNQLQWQLGDVQSGETRVIEVRLRAERSGVFNTCAVARAADGQTAQDCASTSVLTAELDVRMSLRTPEPVQVGQQARFEIVITNRSDLPATGLVITDRYDAGLEHASGANPIERELDALEPGQSRTIGVTFTVANPGQLCNDVTISGNGGVRGAARSCVNAVSAAGQPPVAQPPAEPPPAKRANVTVRMTGPESQSIDGVAEFDIEIVNDGNVDLTNLVIADTFDNTLNPIQATQGYVWEGESLVWKFPSLAAGKTLRLQVNCKCLAAATRACNRIAVSSDQKASGEAQACLAIRGAAASQLTIEVNDLADPVAVGKEVTYEITVKNNGQTADQNVAVLAILPAELSLIRFGTRGPGAYDVDMEKNIRFQTVKEIAPGKTLTYRVRARAQQAGEVGLKVVVKSAGMADSMTIDEKTILFDNP